MSKTALVVDDSTSMRQMVAFVLQQGGFTVIEGANGQEGLDKLDGQPVNVIITDLNMPVMDGMSFLREARGQSDRPAVIVLTGYGTVQSAVEAMKFGAADYLIKPCNPEELFIVIDRQLELRDRKSVV